MTIRRVLTPETSARSKLSDSARIVLPISVVRSMVATSSSTTPAVTMTVTWIAVIRTSPNRVHDWN